MQSKQELTIIMQFYGLKNNKIDDRRNPDVFHLKHFDVLQHSGAMKVGTDAFLLGTLATVVPGTALDIGCGTGILALMLTQREPNLSNVVGIDINSEAVTLASNNFSSSKWSSRLSVIHSSVQNYRVQASTKFDLIISNPPFYKEGFLPKDKTKKINKHTVELSFLNLLSAVGSLLNSKGRFSTITPANAVTEFVNTAVAEGLFLNRKIEIYSRPKQASIRNVMEFIKEEPNYIEYSELIIRNESGQSYSKEYLNLTKDFHRDVTSM